MIGRSFQGEFTVRFELKGNLTRLEVHVLLIMSFNNATAMIINNINFNENSLIEDNSSHPLGA